MALFVDGDHEDGNDEGVDVAMQRVRGGEQIRGAELVGRSARCSKSSRRLFEEHVRVANQSREPSRLETAQLIQHLRNQRIVGDIRSYYSALSSHAERQGGSAIFFICPTGSIGSQARTAPSASS